jgi:hypothetical protein
MYLIKNYPSPITRELIDLANEYGQAMAFARDAKSRADTRRFAQFRYKNRSEMRAFRQFVLDRGFQATLQVDEDDDHNVYTMKCPAAVDR